MILFAFWLITKAISVFTPDHAVSLGVVAPWYGVPLFEQVLFFLFDFSEYTGNNFLIAALKEKKVDDEDFIWKTAKVMLPEESYLTLKKEISIGYYLPRAEMYREIARTSCGSKLQDIFVIGEGELPSIGQSIPKLPGSTIPFDFDIAFNSASLFLYANLHNKEVAEQVLKLLEEGAPFVLRPIGSTGEFGIPVRGYGIEMRPFKYSMEYGVKDTIILDSAKKQQLNLTDDTIDLIKKIPQYYSNVSNISYFGARFCGFINKHKDVKLPRLLRDLTGNFPLFMEELSNSSIDANSFNGVAKLLSHSESTYCTLNGRQVRLEHLDIFTLMDIINEEQNFKNILQSHFKMNPKAVEQLTTMHITNEVYYYLDYESSNLTYYLNDLEKDPEYANWGTTLEDLMNTMGRIPQIRKNLVNIIYMGDPTTAGGAAHLSWVKMLVQDKYPVRCGIIPRFTLGNRLSRKVAYAYHHLAHINVSVANDFLTNTILYVDIDPEAKTIVDINEAHFAASYASAIEGKDEFLKWNQLHTLYGSDTFESKRIAAINDYYDEIGLEGECVLVNGKEVRFYQGFNGLLHEVQIAFQIIMQTIHRFRIRSIEDETGFSILGRIFKPTPSLDREILFNHPESLKLSTKPLSQQIAFLDFIGEIEWNYTDKGRATAFYILLSKNERDIADFVEFAKNQRHNGAAVFAINPVFPNRFAKMFNIDPEVHETTLIADGRIFHHFTLTKLKLIDAWASSTIADILNISMGPYVKYKRTEAMVYMSLLATEWLAETQVRQQLNSQIWEIESSAVYAPNKTNSDETINNNNLNNNDNNNKLEFCLIINPFTREYQRVAGIVDYVQDIVDVKMIAVPPSILNPSGGESIMTYYRNAFETDRTIFTLLDDKTTYSSMADMPDSWIFESMKASVDLDNILLSELSPSTHEGTYILTNVKADGVCETENDETSEYAEGAELALFDSNGERQSDTIVMRFQGYWQISANPGIWTVDLGGSRSKNIYTMVTKTLIVSGFGQRSITLKVRINPGMEGMKVSNLTVTSTTNTTRVDVFSVASGHLYERLLKIMMLAVRRRSQFNVKFWIIKAFLSPQFKATLPIMSKKYNFSYQLVSYKWPTWLRQQVEKQRIIWGNKILFLDVIFPLDLERVIYIDSDQIVRTDLVELMRMDFGDAPYAFTPFCDSRTDTEPYRFWKQGYWLDHLQGKKYHISALFAIDLRRFRQMSAGDWLRYHYQQLSSDPASLSNLDQDLPNYAQVHIPIYSLPQNWLWCETWCSKETMPLAKTIDLCNNPLTKASKLFVAETMVDEWPGLDKEVRNISAGPDEYEKFFFPNKKEE